MPSIRTCVLAGVFAIGLSTTPARAEHRPAPAPVALELGRCGTDIASLQRAAVVGSPFAHPPALRSAASGRIVREGLGTLPNTATSEHFAVRWGDGAPVNVDHVDLVLAGLEAAWDAQVGALGWTRPPGSDVYYVDVYIANTGGVTPNVPPGLAFVSVDSHGVAFIGLGDGFVSAYSNPAYKPFLDSTLAHELNHILQAATGRFLREDGVWLWESTAQWMGDLLFPEEIHSYVAIAEFAYTPELSLDFVSRTRQSGGPSDWRDYGAEIFHLFLTEKYSEDLIRDAWTTADPDESGLAALERMVDALGGTLGDDFVEFAARNVLWDYARGAQIREVVSSRVLDYPADLIHLVSDVVSSEGTTWVEPPATTLPRGMAYNLIRMDEPAEGRLTVGVEGDEAGSLASPAAFRAMLVRERPGTVDYVPLAAVDDLLAEAVIEIEGETALYLVVTAQPSSWQRGETFRYRYRMEFVPPDPEQNGGCAVGGAGASAGSGLLLVLGLLIVGRRRLWGPLRCPARSNKG